MIYQVANILFFYDYSNAYIAAKGTITIEGDKNAKC